MSKKLATIILDVPIKYSIDDCHLTEYDREKIFKLFNDLGFKSLLARLPEFGIEKKVNLEPSDSVPDKKKQESNYKLINNDKDFAEFLTKANEISSNMKNIGILGIIISTFLAVLIFKKVVQYVNEMFHIDLFVENKNQAFWVRRVSEIALLFIVGLLAVASFMLTGFITTVTSLFYKSPVAEYINPQSIAALNTFAVKFLAPFTITFLIFFFLFKWIPEKKVCIKGAFISAVISALIWEITKRVYTYYLVKLSIVGKLGGPIIAIILFGFWMEVSMGIMLFGAKLTSIFDREKDERLKRAQ